MQDDRMTYVFQILKYNDVTLLLSLQFDVLTKIMMLFIMVIGFLIYRYAQNYLESDSTRVRFLSQFNVVLFSVLLLVMSGNLLTAFVAWQLIGINLYILLNHYHYDPAANKAAKKKFVINRIGDCCFLLAIILAYHTGSAQSFESLQYSSSAGFICSLLFVSVMTKCAQFPFHVWLIDTMETPTPVSALMHAGIINAGGILLTRVSQTFMQYSYLNYIVLMIGLLSAYLSIHWMNQQPDVKKKLAYSTMGQMGYMLIQCSLGAFPAAVFHLISHGFYKASLFLNFGETLRDIHEHKENESNCYTLIKSFLVSVSIFGVANFIMNGSSLGMPILMYGFIFITINSMVKKVDSIVVNSLVSSTIYYLAIFLLLVTYFYLFQRFTLMLEQYECVSKISTQEQWVIVAFLFGSQYFVWFRRRPILELGLRDHTEKFLRSKILNPLRRLGDVINIQSYEEIGGRLYILILSMVLIALTDGMYFNFISKSFSYELIFIFLLIGIMALIVANRCSTIKSLINYLIIFELSFVNIALFDNSHNIKIIGYFHAITMAPVILMLYLLSRRNHVSDVPYNAANQHTIRIFYLIIALLLFIGIPGTASFISEFYLFDALLDNGMVSILMYSTFIILTSIVIMHSLQLYAFNKKYSILFSQKIKIHEHVIFMFIIMLNVITGVFPGVLLNLI